MRPLRLLLSLSTCILTLTLLLYVALGTTTRDETFRTTRTSSKKSKLSALFSIGSPSALFPPSAVISLTDDNSTFFLARPAAFGPDLPARGLSGPLWIGSGFGDEAMGTGELGCSDVPDWNDGEDDTVMAPHNMQKNSEGVNKGTSVRTLRSKKQARNNYGVDETNGMSDDDGTDSHLPPPLPGSHTSTHADIQSIQEAAEIAGKVVLLKRGGCGFLEKVMWAQRRGGVALIVGDNVRGAALIRMYAQGDTTNVSIPALFTSHTTAHLLASLLSSEGHLQAWDTLDLGKGVKTEATSTSTSLPSPLSSVKTKPVSPKTTDNSKHSIPEKKGWLTSLFSALGLVNSDRAAQTDGSRRPPSSGNLDWVQVSEWDDDSLDYKAVNGKATNKQDPASSTSTRATDGFIIGEHDWRDPDLLPQKTPTSVSPPETAKVKSSSLAATKGGSIVPGSGEYNNGVEVSKSGSNHASKKHKGWFGGLVGDEVDDEEEPARDAPSGHEQLPPIAPPSQATKAPEARQHEGLWVTLTPTNMSSSPFFDTLLVLVISPLVTLTVVYALLLVRSRIRRRRWRAPKSVVERLPVRTYHTISDSPSPSATPGSSSPTTPLLQHHRSRSPSAHRPRSRTTSDVPATSSSVQRGRKSPEEEKREHGLAEWRRRYGGRQKECVVCLEEYEDGVSQVMSLPCGHEFHADCITPWLVTRRRTCPICKGDVVRSLSQSYHDRDDSSPSPPHSPRVFRDDIDSVQVQAAETRNESPSASRPVPVSGARYTDEPTTDVEANWEDTDPENQERGREIPQVRPVLSSSLRELSSTVQTTIWRGFDAIRGATGLQRRPSREELDRDR